MTLRLTSPWIGLLMALLRRSIAELCRLQFFGAVAAFPYAASFSRAVRPPVRSSASLSGLPHLSPGSLCKVRAENALFSWLASLASSSADAGVAFAVEGPDTSLVWQSPGWERAKGPDSGCTFRVDLCQFGCHWKRRTRVFTNTLAADSSAPLLSWPCRRTPRGRRPPTDEALSTRRSPPSHVAAAPGSVCDAAWVRQPPIW